MDEAYREKNGREAPSGRTACFYDGKEDLERRWIHFVHGQGQPTSDRPIMYYLIGQVCKGTKKPMYISVHTVRTQAPTTRPHSCRVVVRSYLSRASIDRARAPKPLYFLSSWPRKVRAL